MPYDNLSEYNVYGTEKDIILDPSKSPILWTSNGIIEEPVFEKSANPKS